MSKIGVMVKCSDGRWYSHPILAMNDKWFICYDDDEPIELVIQAKNIGMARLTYRIIESQFRKRGCGISQRGNLRRCGERLFAKGKETPEFREAYNVWIYVSNPPSALVMKHNGVFEDRPKTEGVYYD